jgi:hypothetical protein
VALEGVRAAYGLSLLTRGDRMGRLLGGRLLVQGGGTVWAGGDELLHAGGAAVDVLHALSMVGLAAVSRTRRATALRAAGVATGFAAAEVLVCALPALTDRSPGRRG